MCTYLQKRGATYYFRRVIPAELRPAMGGRKEIAISLRTKDREEAKRRVPAQTIATDKLLDEARERSRREALETARQTAAGVAGAQLLDAMTLGSLEAAEVLGRDAAEREYRYEDREPLRLRLRDALARGTSEITPEQAAMRDLLRDREADLDDAALERLERRVERVEQTRGQGRPRGVRPGTIQQTAVPLLATYDAYAAEQGIKPGTAREWRSIINQLVAFLGHDDAARLTIDDLDRWRDALLGETTKSLCRNSS